MMSSRHRKCNLPSADPLLPPLHGCSSLQTQTGKNHLLEIPPAPFLKSDYQLGSAPAGASNKGVGSRHGGWVFLHQKRVTLAATGTKEGRGQKTKQET